MTQFQRHFAADGTHRWYETQHSRYVDPGYYLLVDWLAAGNTPDDVPYVAPPAVPASPIRVSKLKLRRALRASGLEPALDAFLGSDPIYQKDWDDAQELQSDDPILVAAMPLMCQQAGITEEQGQTILESCAIGI